MVTQMTDDSLPENGHVAKRNPDVNYFTSHVSLMSAVGALTNRPSTGHLHQSMPNAQLIYSLTRVPSKYQRRRQRPKSRDITIFCPLMGISKGCEGVKCVDNKSVYEVGSSSQLVFLSDPQTVSSVAGHEIKVDMEVHSPTSCMIFVAQIKPLTQLISSSFLRSRCTDDLSVGRFLTSRRGDFEGEPRASAVTTASSRLAQDTRSVSLGRMLCFERDLCWNREVLRRNSSWCGTCGAHHAGRWGV